MTHGKLFTEKRMGVDVVSDWQPDEEVMKRLEVLRTAVQECGWMITEGS